MSIVRSSLVMATLLLGFGLRVFRLDGQSFWSDEGASVFMTGRSFGDILQAAAGDIHPPLYYLFLRYWSAPTGTSEFAVRFLSLAFGVVLVALVFKLGPRLAGRDVGLVAAFLAATSPFLIYYSQEARMYMQMTTLATLSALLAIDVWRREQGAGGRGTKEGEKGRRENGEKGWLASTFFALSPFRPDPRPLTPGPRPPTPNPYTLYPIPYALYPLLPYILITAACLYTQYFAFTVVLFENVAFALIFWRFWRHWRTWLVWSACQLAIVILYLPWLGQVMGQLNTWPAISEALSPQTLAYRVFLVFSFGLSWDMTTTAKTQILFGVLLLFGVASRMLGKGLDRARLFPFRAISRPSSPVSHPPSPNPQPPTPSPSALYPIPYTLLYVALPIVVMYYLSLRRPMYNPKFLLLATPPFYVLLAMGIVAIKDLLERGVELVTKGWRRRRPRLQGAYSTNGQGLEACDRLPIDAGREAVGEAGSGRPPGGHGGPPLRREHPEGIVARAIATASVLLLLGLITFATSRSLAAYYFDPKYARDDYRGLARYIEVSGRPDDAIVLNAPGQGEIFGYYYKGSMPVLPLPKQRPIDERATEADLKEAASKYRRIWVVFWAERESDPGGFVERWLNQNTFRASNRWYGNARLVLYSVPASTSAGTIQQQVDANLGNKVSLMGYSLFGGGAPSGEGQSAKPGEVLQLTLFWKALAKMEERYVVFTHLLDPHEHIWGQRDAEPGSGAKPTASWAPGAVVSDNLGIPIVSGTPPGEYYVEIGLYLPVTGQRLPVLGQGGEVIGDRVLFGPLRVGKADVPPASEELPFERPLSAEFGPLRVVGYEFFKLGTERGNVDFRRGDIARLALFWQARERPGKSYEFAVRLLDRNGRVVFAKQNPPADGNYPTGQWEKGAVVLDQHKLPLDLPPGKYRLVLGVDDGRGLLKPQGAGARVQGEFVELETIEVK